MSRKLTSTTKKIVAVILFFGIVGFIIQVVGVMRRNDKVTRLDTRKIIVVEEMERSTNYRISLVS